MKKLLMRYLMVNCKEATFLMARKEEGRLGFIEKMKLSMHTSMCTLCRKFEQQTSSIGSESRHVRADDCLSPESKSRMKNIIREQGS